MNNFLEDLIETGSAITILIRGIISILLSRPLVLLSLVVLGAVGGKGIKFKIADVVDIKR